ncbi:hypothetical protein C0995_003229 [Termitomyces sp. Mi166|nr:hypothetical protein C0995_003229 [Termitomyces sp. Mi166\
MPTSFVWEAVFWVLGKCYVNSFLAALSGAPPHQLSPFRAMTSITNTDGPVADCGTSDSKMMERSSPLGGAVSDSPIVQLQRSLTDIVAIKRDLGQVAGGEKPHVVDNMTTNLRDSLLAALARLPGTRTFHLHVLLTSPRKHTGLFPFATPRPRTYLQDILVLLSEQRTGDAPRKFVSALEAHVYTVPSTRSAILYVSKVDSTGHASAPSPTYCLARTLIAFYADPGTRPLAVEHVWVHLFARAQGQYLFPNSAEYEGKRPLSDIRLCGWWKRVFEDVEKGLRDKGTMRLYYVLPGYGESEAVHALSSGSNCGSTGSWIYGHPYSQTEITLPCPAGKNNLGHFIPSFEDDPKSRFMDEIAYTTDGDVESPRRKRRRTETGEESSRALGELSKVSADEFWERMSFRQECVAGAVTGFFTLGISSSSRAEMMGQVAWQLEKRVLTTLTLQVEFSTEERTIRGTEIVEGAIRRLCEGIGRGETTSSGVVDSGSTSLSTYYSDIYGSVEVRNEWAGGGTAGTGAMVRVLTARKKKQ